MQETPESPNVVEEPTPTPAVTEEAGEATSDESPSLEQRGGKAGKQKKVKPAKVKVVRDSFTMPKSEYEQITTMKAACLASGVSVKKSELIRAGIGLLARMSADEVVTLVGELPVIKTGRPKKRK